jgi:H+-translocating diphosphatase
VVNSCIQHLYMSRVGSVQDVADACKTGPATDIIFGLALGYKSCIIPCLMIAIAIFVSFSLANMYGIACAALGMLTTLATGMCYFLLKCSDFC